MKYFAVALGAGLLSGVTVVALQFILAFAMVGMPSPREWSFDNCAIGEVLLLPPSVEVPPGFVKCEGQEHPVFGRLPDAAGFASGRYRLRGRTGPVQFWLRVE